MIFDDWAGIGRVLLVGTLAYASLVLLLRVSGKRTLSKLNAFDLIVTVALGSTLATVLLSKDVALVEGITAFALLIVLQGVITWLSVRHPGIENLIKAEPALLVWQGRFLQEAMRRERVTEDELRAAMRGQGVGRVEDVAAVVLETDGTLDVITAGHDRALTALAHVRGMGGGSDDGPPGTGTR